MKVVLKGCLVLVIQTSKTFIIITYFGLRILQDQKSPSFKTLKYD